MIIDEKGMWFSKVFVARIVPFKKLYWCEERFGGKICVLWLALMVLVGVLLCNIEKHSVRRIERCANCHAFECSNSLFIAELRDRRNSPPIYSFIQRDRSLKLVQFSEWLKYVIQILMINNLWIRLEKRFL